MAGLRGHPGGAGTTASKSRSRTGTAGHIERCRAGAGAALVSQAGESGALRSAAVDAAELSPSGDGGDPDGRRAAGGYGGYRIEFIVRKELEDVPRPVRSTVAGRYSAREHGGAQTEVIDATIYEPTWIYRGRDQAMESELIRRFKRSLGTVSRMRHS